MSKLSQKEAVFNAITSVLAENNISHTEGVEISTLMTSEIRSQVNQILFEGVRNGSIEMSREFNDTELKAYVSGLQSNWIRKDKRLNGGISYVAKNPGSRIGSSDPSLKAMRALLSTLTSSSDKEEVQAAINSRVAEIQASKIKKTTINTEALPEALKALVK